MSRWSSVSSSSSMRFDIFASRRRMRSAHSAFLGDDDGASPPPMPGSVPWLSASPSSWPSGL